MPVIDTVTLSREALDQARMIRALTRMELADRAGVSIQTVQRAHAGRPVSLAKVKRIARALRTPLASLLAQPGGATGAGQLKKLSSSAGLGETGSQSAA